MPTRIFQRLRQRFSRESSRESAHAPRPDLLKRKLAARDLSAHLDQRGDPRPRVADDVLAIERALNVTHGPRLLGHAATPVELRTGVDENVLALVHEDVAHEQGVIPYRFNEADGTLHLAMTAVPDAARDVALTALVRARLGARARTAYHIHDDPTAFQRLLHAYYPRRGGATIAGAASDTARLVARFDGAPTPPASATPDDPATVTFVRQLIDYAHANGATDLTIAPTLAGTTVTVNRERGFEDVPLPHRLPAATCDYLLRVIKQMCSPAVDVLSRGLQKGSFTHATGGGTSFETRVNFSPTKFGQMAVLRIFQLEIGRRDFHELVHDQFTRAHLLAAIESQRGIVVMCSPPRNGKSTLIHSIMRPGIVPAGSQIFSIERPIEQINPHVYQQEVTPEYPEAKLFAHCLQSAATHVFVGEITEPVTADMAFNAVTTGLQVFTTTHSMSVVDTVERFADLGVSRSRIAAGLAAITSTWLLPRICRECAVPVEYDLERLAHEQFEIDEIDHLRPREGRGPCATCGGTGAFGVEQIFETLPLTVDVRAAIAREPAATLRETLRLEGIRAGMTPLRRAVLDLVKAGVVHMSALDRFERMTVQERELLHTRRNRKLLES